MIIATVLFSCKTSPREKALTQMEDYNKSLVDILKDSFTKQDTAEINKQYYKHEIPAIADSTMTEISNEDVVKNILRSEKEILQAWEPIPYFKSYESLRSDTTKKLIRGCASFDRAPANAKRMPAARLMKMVSFITYNMEVPVNFHIIRNQRGEGVLKNMKARINQQIATLNSCYSRFNIRFVLRSVDTTTNDFWFNNASDYINKVARKQMTTALSKNPEKVMNVYSLNSQVLGEATYPWYPERATFDDYVVINYNTLSGGPGNFQGGLYKEGKTLVHEAGHYLGLLHTFEGGQDDCTSDANDGCAIGDAVDDTPSQKICYFLGCDETANSCSTDGNDPVRNYMGYNPDVCMNEFTSGQGDRLLQCIIYYRYHLVTNPIQ